MVGTPFLATTVARARPKLPPPSTVTRTGYGGGWVLDFMERDVVVVVDNGVAVR